MAAERNCRGSPELASGMNIAAFNIGIALGSVIGGAAGRVSAGAPMLVGLIPLVFAAWLASRLGKEAPMPSAEAHLGKQGT